MIGIVRFLAAMVAALLPRQLRSRWAWTSDASFRGPTMVSGLAETMVSLGLIMFRYYAFFEWRLGTIADPVLKKDPGVSSQALGTMAAAFGMGFTTLVEYVFSPLTLLLFYFSIEGALRLFAALVTDECTGTMPLYLIAWALGRAGKAGKECQLGPRVPDTLP